MTQQEILQQPLKLTVYKGYVLLSIHHSDDNGPAEVWHVIDLKTSKVQLQSFHKGTSGAKQVEYRPVLPAKLKLCEEISTIIF